MAELKSDSKVAERPKWFLFGRISTENDEKNNEKKAWRMLGMLQQHLICYGKTCLSISFCWTWSGEAIGTTGTVGIPFRICFELFRRQFVSFHVSPPACQGLQDRSAEIIHLVRSLLALVFEHGLHMNEPRPLACDLYVCNNDLKYANRMKQPNNIKQPNLRHFKA